MTTTAPPATEPGSGTPAPSAAPAAAPAATAPPPSSTVLGGEPPKTEAPKTETPKVEAPAGAPEKYADFTLPEGTQVDQAALAAFAPAMKELNLTQDGAQKLVTLYAEQVNRQAADFGKQLQDPVFATQQAGLMLQQHRDAWAAALKADKDIGGAQFDANAQTAQRAIARFGSPELKQLLEVTGLGNHPALVKAFIAAGKLIREDVPDYGASAGGRKPTHEVLYPSASGAGA